MNPQQAMTPRKLETMMKGRCSVQSDVERLYEAREVLLQQLLAKGLVTAEDLANLDRLGRCKVASEHWAICSAEARRDLLADQHHQVRSCAAVSEGALS
jgi:hypothetical protein